MSVDGCWWLYLLECADGRTYVGIAKSVEKRFRMHAAGRGSVFTRINRPVAILGARPYPTRREAAIAERTLKRLSGTEKRAWGERWRWQHETRLLLGGGPMSLHNP